MADVPELAVRFSAEELLDHAAWIRRLAARLVGEGDADDLAQETWTAALDGSARARGAFRPWLAGVARNLARFRARGETNRLARERAVARPDALPSSADLTQRAELQRLLVDAVLALDEPVRETLLLRYYEGLSAASIAERRGEPAATVRSRLARGVARLRDELDARHAGRREAWTAVLAPLAQAAGTTVGGATAPALTISGAILMKTSLVAAGALALALGLVLFATWSPDAEDGARDALLAGAGTAAPDPGTNAPAPRVADGADAEPLAAAASPGERSPAAPSATAATAGAGPATEPAPSEPPVAPLAGRVLDERTGEPVPFLRFDLLHGDAREELATDVDGRFLSVRAYPAGGLALELVGDRHEKDLIQGSGKARFRAWEWTRGIEHAVDADGRSPDVELRLPVGPTYRLRVPAPIELSLDGLEAALRAADMRFAHDYIYGRVRTEGGGGPWVRFSPLALLLSGGPPYRLQIKTADGLWYGDALVEQIEGVHPGVLDVALGARGAVQGVLRNADGSAPPPRWVQLWGADASFETGDPDQRPQFAFSDEEGRYHHRWILPGRYSVKSDAPGHADYEGTVDVVAGETVTHDVAFVPLAGSERDRVLRGRFRSASGAFHGLVAVVVQEKGGGERRSIEVHWEQGDAGWVGAFETADLVDATYVVSPAQDGFLEITPGLLEVRPDRTDLEFVVEDRVPLADVTVRAVDAETGEPVTSFRSWLTVEPTSSASRMQYCRAEDAVARYAGVPSEFPWEVRLEAEGFAAAWGRSADLDPETGELVVALRRGWAARIRVHAPDRMPVPGVLVTIDGAVAGTTGASGDLEVRAAAEPTSIRFERDGWEAVADSAYNPETGGFRSYLWYLTVSMRPLD